MRIVLFVNFYFQFVHFYKFIWLQTNVHVERAYFGIALLCNYNAPIYSFMGSMEFSILRDYRTDCFVPTNDRFCKLLNINQMHKHV